MSKNDETAQAFKAVNAAMGEALGYDQAAVLEVQQAVQAAAKELIVDFASDCKTDLRIAPCTSIGTILQVAIHALLQVAPGSPVLQHTRLICDMIEREMAGKPPLPAQLQQAQKLGIAISMASRRNAVGGGQLQ